MAMGIDDKNVSNIIYSKNGQSGGYDAIAIMSVRLDKNDNRNNEKCAFSQFKLCECESIGCIIYSMKGGNGNKWRHLCSNHLFDCDYLRKWIEMKGCMYVHCPLCKAGITDEKEKEHIRESEIDSMDQLREKRLSAKKEQDIYLMFHIEQLILEKCCRDKWNCSQNQSRILFNQDLLREVLNHWATKKKIAEFRYKIIESTKQCIANDNHSILRIILKYNSSDNADTHQFINCAAKHQSIDCLKLLLRHPAKIDWSQQKRPIALLNAIKFHPENIEVINFIIDALETLKICFICDDVMQQIIKFDLVDIAKRIVNLRWHKISEKDEEFASHINLSCNLYFKERSKAFTFNQNTNDENALNLDDDEWENDDNDGDEWANDNDDNNDWQNAQD